MSLEGLGKDYLQLLSPYLGPYGCMLTMTCKYMRNNIIIKKYRNITEFYERDGYLELLQWCFRHEWRICVNTDNVPLSVLIWKFKKGLHSPDDAFENACRIGNLDILDYCIRNRFITNWYPTILYTTGTIQYLYNRKDIELIRNIWDSTFYYSEELYEWAFQYQTDKYVSLEHKFRVEADDILLAWSDQCFENIQMMRNYIDLYCVEDIYRRICGKVRDTVAKAIPSTQCECRDPANHENRKRIKYG